MSKKIIVDGQYDVEATGDISLYSSGGTVSITGGGSPVSFAGDISIGGNLTVLGNNTYLESTNVTIEDNIIVLNQGEVGAGVSLTYSGIQVDRGSASDVLIRWNETSDEWEFTNDGSTYGSIISTAVTELTSLVTVGTLDSGAISSGFGNIDIGSSTIGSGIITVSDVTEAKIILADTGAAANNGKVQVGTQGEQFQLSVVNDAINSATMFFTADRTANTVDNITLSATALTLRDATLDSDGLSLATGDTYQINGTAVISATAVGSAVNLYHTADATASNYKVLFSSTTGDTSGNFGTYFESGTGEFTYNPSTNTLVTSNISAGSVAVDNITIDGNTISSTNSNGDVVITPNGSGSTQGRVNLGAINSAFRLPNGTTAQRPGTPAAGDLRYNTTSGNVEFSDGGSWTSFAGLTTNTIGQGDSNITVTDAGSGTVTVTVDSGTVAEFTTGGLNLAASDALSFASTAILSDSAGTMTLSNIDALDATTEATIEAAIDTLSNLTSVGTISSGTWSGSFGAVSGANLTSLTASNISAGNLGSGVLPYSTASATASAFKVMFANTTGDASGNFGPLIDNGTGAFTYNPSTNTLTAGTFSGALSGNATSASSAAQWTTTRTITMSGDVSADAVNIDGSGNITITNTAVANDSHTHNMANLTGTTYAAGSGANLTSLTAANISSGNLGSGVVPYVTGDAGNSAYKVTFADTTGNSSGNFGTRIDSGASQFTYNPSTNTLTAGTFSGALSGNATTASSAAQWTTTRTITMSGDVSADAVNIDGSGNITITNTVVANDSHTHNMANLTGTTYAAGSGANLTALTAANISAGNLGSGVKTYHTATASSSAFKVMFSETTGDASGNYVNYIDSGTGEFTYNPSTNTLTAGTFSGTATQAQYADLAENYVADDDYDEGTVLEFGGTEEVTLATSATKRVAGVVSLYPATLMNSACEGEFVVALALQGRVPVKVRGTVRKGDMMVSDGDGHARAEANPELGQVIGKALEDFDDVGLLGGMIEVVVGRN